MSRLTLIDMFKNESAETFNKCSKAYELGRAEERAKIIETIQKSNLRDVEKVKFLNVLKEQKYGTR